MKKILLVSLALALFVCLFAMGVSAAGFESDYDAAVTTYGNGPDWANVEDKDATAVIKLADSFVRVPAYYVFKANSNSRFENNGSNFDFGWIGEQLGQSVGLDNLVAFEIPYGTTSVSGSISSGTFKSLTELVVPSTVTSLPQKFVRDNVVIERLFIKQTKDADGNVVGVTAIPDYFADMQGSNVSALMYFKLELDYCTSVGANAFNKSAIREITLKGPMTKVSGAFSSCPNLTTVNIDNTGDRITLGGKAFAYSAQLTSVTLNGFNLPDYLFENVNGLTGGLRVIATNVNTLGNMPFKNSTNLEFVTISGPLTSFGTNTFSGCTNINTVTVNNTSDTVATSSEAFDENKGIKHVTMHGVEIGYRMFYKVTTLESLTLSNIGTVIGQEAFRSSTITEFTIPSGFTLISQHAFADCKSLATVTFAGNAGENAEIGYASFENCSALETVNIPEGVTTLGDCPFKNAGVKHLSLPSTLTTANGSNHFYGCKLETVTGLENTKLTSIPGSMFRGASNWKPDVVRIPDTVTHIEKYGFADCGAKVFILGAGVESIGAEAFVNCPNVKEVYIPDTVSSISSDAFKNNKTGNILFFVTSSNADYIAAIKTGTMATSNEAVTHEAYKASPDSFTKGRYVIYGCNICEVLYNNVHAMAGEQKITVTSYFEAITIGDRCTRNGCGNAVVTKTIDAIFVDRGYSCTEKAINGVYSVSQFYEINKTAYDAYVLETGYAFEYGFVVSVSDDPMNEENGSLIDEGKTFITESKFFQFDYFSISVTGFTDGTEGTKDTRDSKLSFCLFVKDGEKLSYLDGGKTVDKITQKSYNDVGSLIG